MNDVKMCRRNEEVQRLYSTCILQQDLWIYVIEEGVGGSWFQLSPVVSFFLYDA